MTKTKLWVRPKGPQAPRPGTELRVQLEQDVDGRPLHPVGYAEVFEGGLALLKLIDTEAGRIAAELLREDCLDAVFGARNRHCDSGKGGDMAFGLTRKQRGPTRSFTHAESCKILKADPRVEIKWSEVETAHWRAVCQCGSEDVYDQPADHRVRLDPYDPSTSRHAGQCEHRSTSDPALLRAILRVRDGAGGGYWWVECGTCDCGWQVPHYALA